MFRFAQHDRLKKNYRERFHCAAQSPIRSEKLRALAGRDRFHFRAEAVHDFFCAEEQTERGGLREGAKGSCARAKGWRSSCSSSSSRKFSGEARLGYEEVHSPEMFEPHFGVDESGKGDFFGPLVIAGVYVDRGIARKFLEAGVQDSKRIGSDARIHALAKSIRQNCGGLYRSGCDRAGKIQRALRKVRQSQQLCWAGGTRA